MLTVTLLQLRNQARQRADMENSTFIADSELNAYINSSYAELTDILVGVFEDYNLKSGAISVVSGTDTYPLPADFYKLRGVDLVIDANGNSVTLKPFSFNERNAYLFTPTWNVVGLSYLRYHMQGNNIRFVPIPNSTQSIKLWYIPAITQLSADGDTLDGVNGFEEYIIIDAAIKMLIKEESDTTALMMQKEALRKRVESMAPNRDAGACERVSDVTKTIPYEFWAFGEGSQ